MATARNEPSVLNEAIDFELSKTRNANIKIKR